MNFKTEESKKSLTEWGFSITKKKPVAFLVK